MTSSSASLWPCHCHSPLRWRSFVNAFVSVLVLTLLALGTWSLRESAEDSTDALSRTWVRVHCALMTSACARVVAPLAPGYPIAPRVSWRSVRGRRAAMSRRFVVRIVNRRAAHCQTSIAADFRRLCPATCSPPVRRPEYSGAFQSNVHPSAGGAGYEARSITPSSSQICRRDDASGLVTSTAGKKEFRIALFSGSPPHGSPSVRGHDTGPRLRRSVTPGRAVLRHTAWTDQTTTRDGQAPGSPRRDDLHGRITETSSHCAVTFSWVRIARLIQFIRDIFERARIRRRPVLSFEFFPTKSEDAECALMGRTIPALQELNPDFCSVTYGAGGSTRQKTLADRRSDSTRTPAHGDGASPCLNTTIDKPCDSAADA